MWKWKAWDVKLESVRCEIGKREIWYWKAWDVKLESVRCAIGKKPNSFIGSIEVTWYPFDLKYKESLALPKPKSMILLESFDKYFSNKL